MIGCNEIASLQLFGAGFGAHVSPPPLPSGASRDFSLGFSLGVWAFLRDPFFVVFQGVRWPCPHGFLSHSLASLLVFLVYRVSCIGISSSFCDFWLGLPLGAGSLMDQLQSAFVLVKPRDPHSRIDQSASSASGRVSPFRRRRLCLDRISSDFLSSYLMRCIRLSISLRDLSGDG